ncbi:MAG: ferrous iron transport protein A [Methanospirillaceae archaeon]|nr:ferrous iron transport protein A [Methanospirillaceae archaeon]
MVPLSLSQTGDTVVVRAIQGTGHLAIILGQLGMIIGIKLTVVEKGKESVIVRIGESRYALGAGAASMVLVEFQV